MLSYSKLSRCAACVCRLQPCWLWLKDALNCIRHVYQPLQQLFLLACATAIPCWQSAFESSNMPANSGWWCRTDYSSVWCARCSRLAPERSLLTVIHPTTAHSARNRNETVSSAVVHARLAIVQGTYVSAVGGLPLFSSDTMFNSGTGEVQHLAISHLCTLTLSARQTTSSSIAPECIVMGTDPTPHAVWCVQHPEVCCSSASKRLRRDPALCGKFWSCACVWG